MEGVLAQPSEALEDCLRPHWIYKEDYEHGTLDGFHLERALCHVTLVARKGLDHEVPGLVNTTDPPVIADAPL